jgi:hypothetical protein
MNAGELGVVVLNWNAAPATMACVTALSAWRAVTAHVVIVDNASVDAAQLAAASPRATVLYNAVNAGYSGGCNAGIRHMMQALPGMPVLLLNNDAAMTEDAAIKLLGALAARPDVGIVGPVIHASGAPHRVTSSGGRSLAWHLDTHRHDVPPAGFRECEFVSGAAVIIRPTVFSRAGFFDERFFFISEMADLCQRARDAGLRTAVFGVAHAAHSSGHRAQSVLHTYYITRNRLLYLRKHDYGYLLGPWAAISLAIAARVGVSGGRAQSRAMALGVRDALSGRFGDQNDRVRKHCA